MEKSDFLHEGWVPTSLTHLVLQGLGAVAFFLTPAYIALIIVMMSAALLRARFLTILWDTERRITVDLNWTTGVPAGLIAESGLLFMLAYMGCTVFLWWLFRPLLMYGLYRYLRW